MTTESDFDDEFNVEEITKAIVDKIKAEVKAQGKSKRHRQY
jgi:hypothetical protein